jgi:hypothetical protein
MKKFLFSGDHFPILSEYHFPDDIVNSINEYIDNLDSDKCNQKYPDLLERQIQNIYLKCNDELTLKIKNYIEPIANEYITYNRYVYPSGKEKVSLLPTSEFGDGSYSYCWVNRYFYSDYTPIHTHSCDIATVIILKYEEEYGMNGKLSFIDFENTLEYVPKLYVGKLFLFPSWMRHHCYPTKLNGYERRTMSINLTLQ